MVPICGHMLGCFEWLSFFFFMSLWFMCLLLFGFSPFVARGYGCCCVLFGGVGFLLVLFARWYCF